MNRPLWTCHRRGFLGAAGGLMAGAAAAGLRAEEPPRVTEPRATSGDDAVEPDWNERLTITVGHHDADRIVDSGPDDGVGIDVQGQTEQITIAANEIRKTRQPMQRVGVRIGAETKDVALTDNQIEGFATSVARLGSP